MTEQPAIDKETFVNNIAAHLPYLRRLACRLTRGDSMSEDVVQQTLLKALIHGRQFRFESALKSWLFTIAVNEARQMYRSSRRTEVVSTLDTVAAAGANPERDYAAREREAVVRDAVARLPDRYRAVIELYDLQLLPLHEVAARLSLSPQLIKLHRHRARRKLRPIVERLLPRDPEHRTGRRVNPATGNLTNRCRRRRASVSWSYSETHPYR